MDLKVDLAIVVSVALALVVVINFKINIMNQIIYFLTFFHFISCSQSLEHEVYLIPSNFEGKVNIIFNQTKGAETKYEDGKRIYEIPADGILLTKFKEQEGFIRREYYYVNGNNKTSLEIVTNEKTINSDEVAIFRDGTTGVYGNSGDTNSLVYYEFYVCNKMNFESYFSKDSIDNFDKKVMIKTGYKF
jgi:hypothetical protein